MKVLTVPNVHMALPLAMEELRNSGVRRESRNGPVLVSPVPVTTVYMRPWERVLFWPERDANPFFHFYEGLWMLSGRNDIAPLTVFVKQMSEYSDDGKTIHDAYGYRWRFMDREDDDGYDGTDQLKIVIRRLQEDPDDRRSVVQMWDESIDLDRQGKAVPCNLVLTAQIVAGRLNIVVFNRSNDIIWGCYGANAVHFSMLQEYLARKIGCPVGTYTQVSVNWHAYIGKLEPLLSLSGAVDPYQEGNIRCLAMPSENLDEEIAALMEFHDQLVADPDGEGAINGPVLTSPWVAMGSTLLMAHWHFRNGEGADRFETALNTLNEWDQWGNFAGGHRVDWIVAAREWVERRFAAWKKANS